MTKTNNTLKIINKLQDALEIPVKPFDTDVTEDCVVYKLDPVSDDGAVQQDRLKLRIIATTLLDAECLKYIIKKTLLAIGDNQAINGINSITLNGGGSLKDYETNTVQIIMYFDIVSKSEI